MFLPCDARFKRGLYDVVRVCPSVRLVSGTFVYYVETSKHILNLFSPSVATTF